MMKFFVILGLLLILSSAQAQSRIPRVGILVQDLGRAQSQAIKGLTAELKTLGYSERKNLFVETRNAKDDRSALQTFANDLAHKQATVIFTVGTRASLAAVAASREVPIVFVHPGDPATVGIMKNSPDSARNITGVAAYAAGTTEKRLELLKEILPALTTIHVFFDANSALSRENLVLAESAAKHLAVQLRPHGVKSIDALRSTLSNLNSQTGEAIYQISDDLVESEADFIFATARKKRLPSMFNEESWAIRGATAAYGPSYLAMGHDAAHLVDQIIKGRPPASLPIARATKFDLTINYRGATLIGLQLSRELLNKADLVIR